MTASLGITVVLYYSLNQVGSENLDFSKDCRQEKVIVSFDTHGR